MTQSAAAVFTLFHWNILVLPTEEEIFVGLRKRPETVPPFLPPENNDEILPYTLQNSSAITEFNPQNGVGFDRDGRRYIVIGPASDPTGMIRFSVSQMLQAKHIRWKYDFGE